MAKRRGKRKTAWDWWSKYVRLKAADIYGNAICVSCGRQHYWKDLQAGHYIHGDSLDFIEENIHPQCIACNHYRKTVGHAGYTEYMYRHYDQKIIDWLKKEKRIPRKYTDYELKEIAKRYRIAARAIAKEKGLEI